MCLSLYRTSHCRLIFMKMFQKQLFFYSTKKDSPPGGGSGSATLLKRRRTRTVAATDPAGPLGDQPEKLKQSHL